MLATVVLAPADSSRAVAALAPLGGVSLLQRLLLTLDAVCPGPVHVVTAPFARDDVARALGDRGRVHTAPAPGRRAALAAVLTELPAARPGDRVLVHEGERALTPASTVAAVIEAGDQDTDAVVPVIPVTDSVKTVGERGLRNVDREGLATLQSPRLLRRDLLTALVDGEGPDDEIQAALARGARVRTVPGSHQGGAVADRLGLWQAQISLGLARDTTPPA